MKVFDHHHPASRKKQTRSTSDFSATAFLNCILRYATQGNVSQLSALAGIVVVQEKIQSASPRETKSKDLTTRITALLTDKDLMTSLRDASGDKLSALFTSHHINWEEQATARQVLATFMNGSSPVAASMSQLLGGVSMPRACAQEEARLQPTSSSTNSCLTF